MRLVQEKAVVLCDLLVADNWESYQPPHASVDLFRKWA